MPFTSINININDININLIITSIVNVNYAFVNKFGKIQI